MIPGSKTLLFGPPGGGKSHAVRTLLEADKDLQVFCLFTEPSGMAILGDTPVERLHWHYVAPSQPGFASLIQQAKNVNTFSVDKLFGMEGNKKDYSQFIDLLLQMSNFHCERCDKDFGSVDSWSTDRVFVLDSLSGLNLMARELTTGGKPAISLPEWGVAIDTEAKLINTLTLGCESHFVLIAHVDREVDEVLGGQKLLPAALGRKLPAQIGRFFDDVVYASHNGATFQWSTLTANVDSKARMLPIAKELKPTFVAIIEAWKRKGGQFKPTVPPVKAVIPSTGVQK